MTLFIINNYPVMKHVLYRCSNQSFVTTKTIKNNLDLSLDIDIDGRLKITIFDKHYEFNIIFINFLFRNNKFPQPHPTAFS